MQRYFLHPAPNRLTEPALRMAAAWPVIQLRRQHALLPWICQRPRMFHMLACLLVIMLLPGCSPRSNWREIRSGPDDAAAYRVLLPAKPSSLTREIDLGGQRLPMAMTAAKAGGVSFAVGSIALADSSAAAAALQTLKSAMIGNIRGTLLKQQPIAGSSGDMASIDIEASGTAPDGSPVRIAARFVAVGRMVYQVVALGPAAQWPAEEIEAFLASFKPG